MKRLTRSVALVCTIYVLSIPLLAQPQISGNGQFDNLVRNRSWRLVNRLSDEFNGFQGNAQRLNTNKWDPRPVVPNRFNWVGRWPGLFEPENVRVFNGQLWIEAEKFTRPKTDSQGTRNDWTHGGGIVRSVDLVRPGMYVEARMRTTETIFSGTFWLITPSANCNNIPKTELNITESIGRKTGVFLQPELGWYASTADKFEVGANGNCRQRGTNCLPAINRPRDWGTFDPSKRFTTYGLYWESPTRIHFFVDGIYRYSITPPIPFANPMAIIMAVETYDFNLPTGTNADGFGGSMWARSTKYLWVRTWERTNSSARESSLSTPEPATPELAVPEMSEIQIFPNPSVNDVIRLTGMTNDHLVEIYDLFGTKVKSVITSDKVDIRGLSAGMYLIKIEGNARMLKFVKE
ncbi:MAG: T9SS type A sorting domain-containing protein [Bacteroidota bacterium]